MPELEAIFAEAIALDDPDQRQDFLDSVCKGKPKLRNRVSKLIDANRRAHSFMSEPVAIVEVADDNTPFLGDSTTIGEQPGDRIGNFELVRQIGEGGMGWVFEAKQLEPIRRDVALKVVKPGLDTREVMVRFESERQSLALMDHPNIAKVLDAGATPSGRPYFAMELVQGSTLTEFCNAQKLTTKQRLEIFIPICHAIQHAHQKGIIHRDIKPRNLLVTDIDGQLEPKVIDFGIAKAIDATVHEDPFRTKFGQFIGTPAYMSPEQADADSSDVDTRSDVYSLGATLYELLAGVPPFDEAKLKTKSSEEIRRFIADETPMQPSQAVSTIKDGGIEIAQDRCTTPAQLASSIRGELDWIVLRALEKERDRRYPTATALAEDLQRYLDNEVVLARPVSQRYRLRKLLQRNRKAVSVALAFGFLLLVASCVSTGLAIWAFQSRKLANEKATLAEAKIQSLQGFQDFISRGLFAPFGPFEEPNRNIQLQTVIKRAVQKLDNDGPLRPDVEAPIRATIGQIYLGLGEYRASLHHLERARNLFGQLENNGLELAQTNNQLARAHLKLGQVEQIEPLLAHSLRIAKSQRYEELRWQTKQLQAQQLDSLGEPEQAESLLREILASRKQSLGKQHVETHKAVADLGIHFLKTKRLAEAKPLLESAHKGLLATQLWNPATLKVAVRLAETHLRLGNIDRAKELYQNALHDTEQQLGEKNSQTLAAKKGLSQVSFLQKDYREAAVLLEEVLSVQSQQFGKQHETSLATTNHLATIYSVTGEFQKAESLYRNELLGRRQQEKESATKNSQLTQSISEFAFFYVDHQEFAKAIPLYSELVTRLINSLGDTDETTLVAQTMLALCQYKNGDHEAAALRLEPTLQHLERSYPLGWLRPIVQGLLGEVMLADGNRKAAELHLVQSYEILKQSKDDVPLRWKSMGLRAATRRMAEFFEEVDDTETARAYRDELTEIREAVSKELGEKKRNLNDGGTD